MNPGDHAEPFAPPGPVDLLELGLPVPVCPPQHAARTTAAGVDPCPIHGCALCATSAGSVGYCSQCDLRAVDVALAEGPAADPSCLVHGLASAALRRECQLCDWSIRRARKVDGWREPTGHDGPDCAHCDVCGLCKGTGHVCRWCWRCPEHPLTEAEAGFDPSCQQSRTWGRGQLRREVTYFEHSYFDLTTQRWGA